MIRRVAMAALALAAGAAEARVAETRPDSFDIVLEHAIPASPASIWATLIDLPRWWDGSHTYSNKAANLTLDARAGGCWCERWADGRSVEHARVLSAMPPGLLRLSGGLGPLQELPVNAVMTVTVGRADSGTRLRVVYRVAGPGAGKLAGPVDGVLAGQFERLAQAAALRSGER